MAAGKTLQWNEDGGGAQYYWVSFDYRHSQICNYRQAGLKRCSTDIRAAMVKIMIA